jgi:3-oxoacyl-[acyl-carrier-protein] synthase III
MAQNKTAKVTAWGRYLPEKVLTNADLERIVETSDEWITTRTGIKERRIAKESEFPSTMGATAAKIALDRGGLSVDDVDLILVATLTPDYLFPSTACLIQKELGCSNAAAFDFQSACSGYIYGLSLAKAYIESGQYKNVLLVASEKLSAITDYEDRSTCVLFGDGASCALIQASDHGLEIASVNMGCDGKHAEILIQPAGGSRQPATAETVKNREHYIKMQGAEVFKLAVRNMIRACESVLDVAKLTGEDIDWLIPHQANMRIIDAIASRFHIDDAKVFKTVQKYGNTSASSVGIALEECLDQHTLREGGHLLLTAFGAGLTWGAALLKKV